MPENIPELSRQSSVAPIRHPEDITPSSTSEKVLARSETPPPPSEMTREERVMNTLRKLSQAIVASIKAATTYIQYMNEVRKQYGDLLGKLKPFSELQEGYTDAYHFDSWHYKIDDKGKLINTDTGKEVSDDERKKKTEARNELNNRIQVLQKKVEGFSDQFKTAIQKTQNLLSSLNDTSADIMKQENDWINKVMEYFRTIQKMKL